jgi:hypothetical protein
MNESNLESKREELEKQLQRMEDAHSKKFAHIASESAYRDSAKAIYAVYKQLFDISMELGKPIPVRF